ncbi:hypothetical protein LPC08_14395 [Roseomonas sp. OT10]|uniref:hypothetical protein n=1 Tax=Roseomonas cutis TaxID=2897332 RepID=UPI001E64B510|nr:hypothetical protein [Roseomonas sp. OT10]UFN47216.1 hypothetical protein LPC08_14395 [Roseomonas sp. OT10]
MSQTHAMRRLALSVLLLLAPLTVAAQQPMQRGAAPRPPSPAEQRRVEAQRLLDELGTATDAASASTLETRLRLLWAQEASPAVVLLLRRATRNMEAQAFNDATEDLDAAITLQPDYPEAWILRARAQAAAGDARAAARDLQEALRLEPRHFGALLALSALQEDGGDLNGALRSLEAAVKLNPRMAGGEQRLRDLRRRALGDST